MSAIDLLALAERCEAATAEQQRDLLQSTWLLCNPDPPLGSDVGVWPNWNRDREWFDKRLDVLAFIDAALTLVPEGLDPQICKGPMFALAANEARPWGVSLIGPARDVDGEVGPEIDYDSHDANAATAALAICAAALRAKASDKERE